MRINVYAEEITLETAIVEKDGHRGLRVYLKSHPDLHNHPDDDDRSAITFWGLRLVTQLLIAMNETMDRR